MPLIVIVFHRKLLSETDKIQESIGESESLTLL